MIAQQEVVTAVRVLVGLLFLAASVGKMRHWRAFQGVVANYRLLPGVLVPVVAYLLPPVELALAAGLFVPHRSPAAEITAAALLVLFALAMAINIGRGRGSIDCGCFQSTLKQTLNWVLVARNAVLAAALLTTVALDADGIGWWPALNGILAGAALYVAVTSQTLLWSTIPAFKRAGPPGHSHAKG